MTGSRPDVDCQPEAVSIGMPVQATFEDVTDDIALVYFAPASGPAGATEESA